MKKVVIVGGGVSGLLAAAVFNPLRGFDSIVIEANQIGGDFLKGGLKYLHRTDPMVSLLIELGVSYTNHLVRGGILLRGCVYPYPGALRSMERNEATRIQHDHYRKTRRVEPDGFSNRSMNDPEGAGPRRALICDPADFVQALRNRATVRSDMVVSVHDGNYLKCKSGDIYRYDYLILTVPLWIIRRIANGAGGFNIPEAVAMKLNIVPIEMKTDTYASWDYVYTPYTPENLIHRISQKDGMYSCEFNGDWDAERGAVVSEKLISELNFLSPDGWAPGGPPSRGMPGHLLPLKEKIASPSNVRLLGRFSEWDPRATSDVVLDSALKLAKEWR